MFFVTIRQKVNNKNMKRFISITLFLMTLVMLPSLAKAQNDGTFNRQTLKSPESTNASKEQRVDRKTTKQESNVQKETKHQFKEKTEANTNVMEARVLTPRLT